MSPKGLLTIPLRGMPANQALSGGTEAPLQRKKEGKYTPLHTYTHTHNFLFVNITFVVLSFTCTQHYNILKCIVLAVFPFLSSLLYLIILDSRGHHFNNTYTYNPFLLPKPDKSPILVVPN